MFYKEGSGIPQQTRGKEGAKENKKISRAPINILITNYCYCMNKHSRHEYTFGGQRGTSDMRVTESKTTR
jgi:hypothetical protein